MYRARAMVSFQGPARPVDQLEDERAGRAGGRVAEDHAFDRTPSGRVVVDHHLGKLTDQSLHAADARHLGGVHDHRQIRLPAPARGFVARRRDRPRRIREQEGVTLRKEGRVDDPGLHPARPQECRQRHLGPRPIPVRVRVRGDHDRPGAGKQLHDAVHPGPAIRAAHLYARSPSRPPVPPHPLNSRNTSPARTANSSRVPRSPPRHPPAAASRQTPSAPP